MISAAADFVHTRSVSFVVVLSVAPYTQIPTFLIFFFNHTAPTEIYTFSLHDALPISRYSRTRAKASTNGETDVNCEPMWQDRKSTRLNSSHVSISYAVFCLKKKNSKSMRPVTGP